MDLKVVNIEFTDSDKGQWLKKIYDVYKEYADVNSRTQFIFSFGEISKTEIEPLHLVTLACLIQFFFDKGHAAHISQTNKEVFDYIYNDLDFAAYWSGGQNHVNARFSSNIFNLWRIVESEKDLYAKKVEEYFKSNYFADKDLSAISISLVEAFYNVFDHADAKGNAFSVISYNNETHRLSYAVADFGIGIPASVKNYISTIETDIDAILWALEDNSTVKSTKRNKGFGMGNILSAASHARIFSNEGLIFISQGKRKTYTIDTFPFPGTLIYLDIDMNTLEDEEVLDVFRF